jgi:hypothetical protein
MRIIKLSFRSKCPLCNHTCEGDFKDFDLECVNCGHSYNPFRKNEEARPFRSSPVPQNNDRRIRSSNNDEISELEDLSNKLGSINESLRDSGVCCNLFSVKLDLDELIYDLKS